MQDGKFREIKPRPYTKRTQPSAAPQSTGVSQPTGTQEHLGATQSQSADTRKTSPFTSRLKLPLVAGIAVIVLFALGNMLLHKVSFTTEPQTASVAIAGTWNVATDDGYYILSGAHRVIVSAEGYYPNEFDFVVPSRDGSNHFMFALEEKPGHLRVIVTPKVDAQLTLNEKDVGSAAQIIKDLPAGEYTLGIRAEGYQPSSQEITITGMDRTQTVEVDLVALPPEEKPAPPPATKPPAEKKPPPPPKTRQQVEAAGGLQFVILKPSNQKVSYEKGRQMHTVTLTRPFAISKMEISNRQFRAFRPSHASGAFQSQALDGDDQPAVNLRWSDAALFANWLSKQAGVKPFYIEQAGKITGFNRDSTGYRLPTEAEWVLVAQGDAQWRYPWGNHFEPVPDKAGNYADKSAAELLTRTLPRYDDGYATSAPGGQFLPNSYGAYDIGGNVAEWLHDVFSIYPLGSKTDPLGADRGSNHVVRGGSWKYGSQRMLETAYRQYHIDQGKPEVGFRLAYYKE